MEATVVHERQALTYGLGAVLLWSTVATGFKLGLNHLTIEQLLLLGTIISWLVFLIYSAYTRSWYITKSDRWLILALGLINPFAYYLLLFAAYDRLPAHIAQPLNYTWAITLALLAVPILKQPLTKKMLLGIGISYAGVLILLYASGTHDGQGWDGLGVTFALLSTVLWAVYWLLNTRSHSAPGAMMFWSFTIALPCIALVCYLGPGLPEINAETLLYGTWVGVIEMGVTFLLWQQALRRTTNAARIGQLIFLSPFISLIIIYFALDEHITWRAVAALCVIVLGMQFSRPPPRQETIS